MDAESHELDLPLSANWNDVKVQHFILDWSCNMTNKTFQGIITLFCEISGNQTEYTEAKYESQGSKKDSVKVIGMLQNEETSEQSEVSTKDSSHVDDVHGQSISVCLDCFAQDIVTCSVISLTPDHTSLIESDQPANSLQISQSVMIGYQTIYKSLKNYRSVLVDFAVHKHSLTIWLPQYMGSKYAVIQVHYRTRPEGPSLMWTVDQNGRPCVFTAGHLLNNRSLFPSQDLPQAMSTWHCSVTLTEPHTQEMTVLMTGESEPEVTLSEKGEKVFNFYNSYPMPASTFALAVGVWSATCLLHSPSLERWMPHCRVFSPKCLREQCIDQLGKYLPRCFEVLNSILGPYPLKHLDILIVPECFDSLGMAW